MQTCRPLLDVEGVETMPWHWNMMDHWGWMFGGGFLLMVLLIVLIFAAFRGTDRWRDAVPRRSPEDLLKERLAKGEINEDEYDRLLRKLKE
jgi:putative membrane protein